MAVRAGKNRLKAVSGLHSEWRIFTENGVKNAALLGRDGQQSGLVEVDIPFDRYRVKAVSVSTTDLLQVSRAREVFTVVGPRCAAGSIGEIKRDCPDYGCGQLE